jgi:DNA-directed RNA polymerase subunit RPC12/RpoP
MAMITCSECGKEFSDKAPSCPNCGCPTEQATGDSKQAAFRSFLQCPRCKGHNVEVTLQSVEEKSKGKNELRKKSAITRAGNKMGRAAMIGMTGGLWGLTPKKSDYNEVSKGKTKVVNKKLAVCQDCGKTWKLFF